MVIAIVKKAFKNLNIKFGLASMILKLNKFAFKAFNWLSYNWKVSRLLIASFLFNLLNYYFLIAVIKTINIALLKTKFKLILNSQNLNQLDNIIHINSRKVSLYFIY